MYAPRRTVPTWGGGTLLVATATACLGPRQDDPVLQAETLVSPVRYSAVDLFGGPTLCYTCRGPALRGVVRRFTIGGRNGGPKSRNDGECRLFEGGFCLS